ncbi:MAG: flagellar hook-length control protein FliK [Phycisphaerales bacterium]
MISPLRSETPGESVRPARHEGGSSEGFRAALAQQSLGRLDAITDASSTEALPGAGSALVGAVLAQDGDAAGVASASLREADPTRTVRERGLDAASRSAAELSRGRSVDEGSEPGASLGEAVSRGPERSMTVRRESATTAQSAGSEPGSASVSGRADGRGASTPPNAQAGAKPVVTRADGPGSGVAGSAVRGGESRASSVVPVHGTTGLAGVARVSASVGSGGAPASGGNASGSPLLSLVREASTRSEALVQRSSSPSPGRDAPEAGAQVQRGLAQVLRQGGGSLTLRLTPNDLGEVRVSLQLAGGRVSGTIEATTESARDLLQQQLDTLRSSLERRGVTVDRLDVRLQEGPESTSRGTSWQDAGGSGERSEAHAGGGGSSQQGGAERRPDLRPEPAGEAGGDDRDAGDGARRGSVDGDAGQGGPAERHGVWLRLDVTG